ncbi:MAG TPA: serine/threonine-protein kinase [Myxococcales bacterium]|nr:serine/threonine-protein kinase [Myxococcales bacterium]
MSASPDSLSPTPSPATQLALSKGLGRYALLGKLAEGGMAEVYLARQHGPKGFAKTVVIKKIRSVISGDQHFVRMFLNEARLAALINHPNVVSIYELGEEPETGSYYLVMEYIDGCTARTLVDELTHRGRRLPANVAVRIVADACAGLDFAHNLQDEEGRPLNIVHRDISLENILVAYSGLVKVVDFGLAKATMDDGRTPTGQLKGKFGYLAPELLRGKPADRRTDVWALGVVLYRLLSARKPFPGEIEGQIVNEILFLEPSLESCPEDLRPILARALAKDPAQRYQTAADFQRDLESWLARSGLMIVTSSISVFVKTIFPESHRDRVTARALLATDSGWEGSATWISKNFRKTAWILAAIGTVLVSVAADVFWLRPTALRRAAAAQLAVVDARMDEGRLVGPGGDEALDHLLLARRLAGDTPAVAAHAESLADVLVRLAHDAETHGEKAEVAAKLEAALLADPTRTELRKEIREVETEARLPVPDTLPRPVTP